MPSVTKSIDVAVPVAAAYDKWTQFESFPYFMGGVESVTQIDATHSHWVTTLGGVIREFDTVITEQQPDERVAWTSTEGTDHAAVVRFHRLSDKETRVTVELEWQARGIAGNTGALVGLDDHQVGADLDRFKDCVEKRGGVDGQVSGPGV
ncbi:MAG: putative 17 [Frankiales bacterium]|jgi:uncharacterized membrane protein|nr:putative 17 [Frankiales bacterium]